MLAKKTALNKYVTKLALSSSQSGSELNQLRWSWLLHPSSTSVGKLTECLKNQKTSLTETALELENTVLWISLFDPAFTHRKCFHSRSSLFEKIENPETRFENLLVRYFIAHRNGNQKLTQSLLQLLDESFISSSSQATFDGTDSLIDSVELLSQPHGKNPVSLITVNLGHWEIQAHGKRFISKPLCLFIDLLRTNLSISFDDLLAAAFDIPKYDESFHYQKIQNLISRLRVLSPDFVVNTRQGRIYSSIQWEQVQVLSMSVHQESLKQSGILNLFLDPEIKAEECERSVMRVSISKLKSALVAGFSRADFERVTGFPRSTASRFLKNWVDQEILLKSGAGKATIYIFK
jgi:hypothetical protein